MLKVATKDWHPANHISFAANHAGKRAYVDTAEMTNPRDPRERQTTRLWPAHCVQGSPGAGFVAGLDAERFDRVVLKGADARFEMYSPFRDSFTAAPVCDTGLAALLRARKVTDVFVVGLAGDYCVGACAVDAAEEGFRTYLIGDCTRPVDAAGWDRYKESLLLLRRGQEGKGGEKRTEKEKMEGNGDGNRDGVGVRVEEKEVEEVEEGSRAKGGGGTIALVESHLEVLRLMTGPEGRRHIWGRSVRRRM